MTLSDQGEVRLLAQRAAAAATLRVAGSLLRRLRIPVVAAKGAWLLESVYSRDELRPTTDVDLVVWPADFRCAVEGLRTAGCSVSHRGDPRQVVVTHRDFPLPIDLHRAIFPTATYRLRADDVMVRSRRSPVLGVRFPEPTVGFGHLVGHFALSRDVRGQLARARDFELLGRYYQLNSAAVANEITGFGLQRALRYVARVVSDQVGPDASRFLSSVVVELAADPIGSKLANYCARRVLAKPLQPLSGTVILSLLQPTWQAVPRSLVGRVAERVVSAVKKGP